MTATAEPQVLPDAGPGRCCGDVQWDHKRGKGGCKVPGCGCDKYLPPKTAPAPPTVTEEPVVASALGEVHVLPVDEPAPAPPAEVQDLTDIVDAELRPVAELMEAGRPEPTCAYPNGEDDGEHDHAMCEDVVAEQVEQLTAEMEQVRSALGVRDHAGVLEGIAAFGREINRLNRVLAERAAELGRTQATVDRLSGQLQGRLADLDEERREHQATGAVVTRLREELDRANAGRQQLQFELDNAVATLQNTGAAYLATTTAAAAGVLERQDRFRCNECGRRYGQRFTDHECGPLTPVTVLIVRREAPGA